MVLCRVPQRIRYRVDARRRGAWDWPVMSLRTLLGSCVSVIPDRPAPHRRAPCAISSMWARPNAANRHNTAYGESRHGRTCLHALAGRRHSRLSVAMPMSMAAATMFPWHCQRPLGWVTAMPSGSWDFLHRRRRSPWCRLLVGRNVLPQSELDGGTQLSPFVENVSIEQGGFQ